MRRVAELAERTEVVGQKEAVVIVVAVDYCYAVVETVIAVVVADSVNCETWRASRNWQNRAIERSRAERSKVAQICPVTAQNSWVCSAKELVYWD